MAFARYGLVQWTVGLSLPPDTLAARALPTADAMSAVCASSWGGRALALGGAVGILTTSNAFFLGASRLLFAMARGEILPTAFPPLYPRYRSPAAVLVPLTAITAVAPFVRTPALPWLVDPRSLATVVTYLLVAAALLLIPRRHPDLLRPYPPPPRDPSPSSPCRPRCASSCSTCQAARRRSCGRTNGPSSSCAHPAAWHSEPRPGPPRRRPRPRPAGAADFGPPSPSPLTPRPPVPTPTLHSTAIPPSALSPVSSPPPLSTPTPPLDDPPRSWYHSPHVRNPPQFP